MHFLKAKNASTAIILVRSKTQDLGRNYSFQPNSKSFSITPYYVWEKINEFSFGFQAFSALNLQHQIRTLKTQN